MAVRHSLCDAKRWRSLEAPWESSTKEQYQNEASVCMSLKDHCSLIFELQKILVVGIPASFYRKALTVTPPKSKLLQEKVPTATKGIEKDFALEAEAG